ncbi:MAG: hypothetical protein LWY06_20465 [Firmicutes bacterium]|nr:hypothetical protein [Bacillota bacterium]
MGAVGAIAGGVMGGGGGGNIIGSLIGKVVETITGGGKEGQGPPNPMELVSQLVNGAMGQQ